MAYLVLKGDSYTRKVNLTNTCNKPRIACKNGNSTSYIPVVGGGGTKNLRISNSYIDIRMSSPYNTTTNTTSMVYTNSVGNTTTSSTSMVGKSSTTSIIKTSSEYNYNYDSTITIDPTYTNYEIRNTGFTGLRYYTYEIRGTDRIYTWSATFYKTNNGGLYYDYETGSARSPYDGVTFYETHVYSFRNLGMYTTTRMILYRGPETYISRGVYSGNYYATKYTVADRYIDITGTTSTNTTSRFYYYEVHNTTTSITTYSYY